MYRFGTKSYSNGDVFQQYGVDPDLAFPAHPHCFIDPSPNPNFLQLDDGYRLPSSCVTE